MRSAMYFVLTKIMPRVGFNVAIKPNNKLTFSSEAGKYTDCVTRATVLVPASTVSLVGSFMCSYASSSTRRLRVAENIRFKRSVAAGNLRKT